MFQKTQWHTLNKNHSCMSVCFLTCAMCKKVLQNLIPLAQWPIDEKSCGACCCQCQEEICRATGQVVSCIKLTEEKSQKHFSQHLTAKWSLELFTLQKICQKRKAKCFWHGWVMLLFCKETSNLQIYRNIRGKQGNTNQEIKSGIVGYFLFISLECTSNSYYLELQIPKFF